MLSFRWMGGEKVVVFEARVAFEEKGSHVTVTAAWIDDGAVRIRQGRIQTRRLSFHLCINYCSDQQLGSYLVR
jgi:hypothetical protein